jgi:hypothetical protein
MFGLYPALLRSPSTRRGNVWRLTYYGDGLPMAEKIVKVDVSLYKYQKDTERDGSCLTSSRFA